MLEILCSNPTTKTLVATTGKIPVSSAVIASLPDLSRIPAGEAFDSAIDAIITALDALGYVRVRTELPAVDQTELRKLLYGGECPGVLSFQRFPPDSGSPTALAVLVTGESWTSGVVSKQLLAALGMLDSDRAAPLRVLGPYYSASAPSMLKTLNSSPRKLANVWMLSGSMSVDRALRHLAKASCSEPTFSFRSLAVALSKRRRRLCTWLTPDCAPALGPFTDEPTCESALREDAPEDMFRAADATKQGTVRQLATIRTIGTAYGYDDNAFNYPIRLAFPFSLSELRRFETKPGGTSKDDEPERKATGSDSAKQERTGESKLALGQRSETLQWSEPLHSSTVYHAAVRQAAHEIRVQGLNQIFMSSERVGDAIFLGKMLKQELPDLRLVFDHWDLALLHKEHLHDLHGSLVTAAYLPRVESDNTFRLSLARDQARGIYDAVRCFWTPAREDGKPACLDEPQRESELAVIVGGQMIPLTGQADVAVAPEMTACVMLLLLLAFADFIRVKGLSPAGGAELLFVRLEKLRDPELQRRYAQRFWLARCGLAAMWLLLFVVCVAALCAAQPTGARPWTMFLAVVVLGCAYPVLFVWLSALAMLGFELPKDRPSWRAYSGSFYGGLLALVVAILASVGFLFADDADPLLARSVDVLCGASPLSVLMICMFTTYGCAVMNARRIRVLDEALDGEPAVTSLCAVRSGDTPPKGRLYEAAVHGSRVRVQAVLVLLLLVLVVATPPLSAWLPRVFTLEETSLHMALMLALLLVLGQVMSLGAQLASTAFALNHALADLASSTFFTGFDSLPWATPVSQHLWRSLRRTADFQALWRRFGESEPCPSPPHVGMRELLSKARKLEQTLRETPGPNAKAREQARTNARARRNCAALVAFELGFWLLQITTLTRALMLACVGLLTCSWVYVFGLRRLMVTMTTLLTLGAVAFGLVVFRSLERDPVFKGIGGKSSDGALHPSWQRLLIVSTLPIALALATYYPAAWTRLLEWIAKVTSQA